MLFSQLLRFAIVGISNTALSFIAFYYIYNNLHDISFAAGVAQTISYLIGACWSFFMNRLWTFRSERRSPEAAVKFFVLQFALLSASSLSIFLLVDLIGLNANLSWMGIMCFSTAINYYGQKTWVFGGSHTAPAPP